MIRIGLVQFRYHPALEGPGINWLGEPFVDRWDQPKFWGIPYLREIAHASEQCNVARVTRLIDSVTAFAKSKKLNVLVFPEYSVPPSLVPYLRAIAREKNLLIIGGSHGVEMNRSHLGQIYHDEGIAKGVFTTYGTFSGKFLALCPVILPSGEVNFVPKRSNSQYDPHITPAPGQHTTMNITVAGESFPLSVLLCSDCSASDVGNGEDSQHGLMILSTMTPRLDFVLGMAIRAKTRGVNVAIVNHADGGGSQFVTFADSSSGPSWLLQEGGSVPLGNGMEAVLIAELDVHARGRDRGVVNPHSRMKSLERHILFFSGHSNFSASLGAELAAAGTFTLAGTKVELMDSTGIQTHELPVSILSQLDAAKEAREALHSTPSEVLPHLAIIPVPSVPYEKHVSGLASVMFSRLNSLMSEQPPKEEAVWSLAKQTAVKAMPSSSMDTLLRQDLDEGFATPGPSVGLLDRKDEEEKLSKFLDSTDRSLCVISGLPGIGKHTLIGHLVNARFPKPGMIRRIKMPLGVTEGDLGAEFDRCLGRTPTDRSSDLAMTTREFLFQLERSGCRILIIDQWEVLFNESVQHISAAAKTFHEILADPSQYPGVKRIAVSKRRGAAVSSASANIHLSTMPESASRQLLAVLVARAGPLPRAIPKEQEDRIIRRVRGYPVAIRAMVAAASYAGWKDVLEQYPHSRFSTNSFLSCFEKLLSRRSNLMRLR